VRGHRDLTLVARGSVLCALLALVIPWPALSLLFAAPLILFAPGYAIVAVTFAQRPLGRERLALLSLALSLATLVIGGFVLNYMPGGIRAISWAILLPLVTLACCRAAALRRPRAGRPGPSRLRLGRRDAAFLLGGLALSAAALVLAMATLPAENARGFTQLWVTPTAGSAEIGVASEEQHLASYVLRTRLGKGGRPVLRRFTLRPGETHTIRLDLVPSPRGRPVAVSARLFRRDRPGAVYRRVSAWIPAAGASR
jgi:hypothetical protein